MVRKSSFLFLFFFFLTASVFSQSEGIVEVESAIAEKDYTTAIKVLKEKIGKYYRLGSPDSLLNYMKITGKVYYYAEGRETGDKETEALLKMIKALNPSAATISKTYVVLGDYYGFTGDNRKAYESNEKALEYIETVAPVSALAGRIENNLSTYAQRSGKIGVARQHGVRAIQILSSLPDPDYVLLYLVQNSMGSSMFYESKMDSAAFYFEHALTSLSKAPPTSENRYYRTSILYNNLAGVYSSQGKMQLAIDRQYASIENLEKFIGTDEGKKREMDSKVFMFQGIDNLGGLYKKLGNYQKAKELLEYSYREKSNNLPLGNREVFNSQILIGRLLRDMREEKKAQEYLLEGIGNLERMEDPDPFWLGDGYYSLAEIYDAENDIRTATKYYKKSDSLYKVALEGAFDDIYLEFLTRKSKFFATHGEKDLAVKDANRAYNYVLDVQGKRSLAAYEQLINLAYIEFTLKGYDKSYGYAASALKLVNDEMLKAESLLDAMEFEARKPLAILYKAKASYALQKNKDKVFLESKLKELQEALDIVDRKKNFLGDEENSRVLLAENESLFDFVKQLNLGLYRLTNEPGYINKIMGIQESVLYSRIRSRLNAEADITFSGVPDSVLQRERQLDSALDSIARTSGRSAADFTKYISATRNQNDYRAFIRTNYPDYYRARYQSVLAEPINITSAIPSGYTLVRYFFAGDDLYALVADKETKKIFQLDGQELTSLVNNASGSSAGLQEIAVALHQLYKKLWSPFASEIHNKKIVVIPDGILYNLNLEILTPEKINSFSELATKGLISKYIFSYQYSILLMNHQRRPQEYSDQFVGFAPVFSDKMKDSYKVTVTDPLRTDFSYLKLLPQPFSQTLLQKLRGIMGGKSFYGKNCTKEAFLESAGKNKIVHVGTHAVSDNLNPGFSKLIFAKDKSGSDGNVLYVNELYGYNLPAALTVLSACETGKPGYRDGEGMISLAHAFNYAGSESMLTGLWKIDEKASAEILEKFYDYLLDGMEKDEALQKAKLDYLSTAQGRMKDPQFWAGLVIIGDTSALDLERKDYTLNYILEALALMAAGATVYVLLKRRSRRKLTINKV